MHLIFRWSLPLRYYFESRLRTIQSRISWVFIYIVPVMLLSQIFTEAPLSLTISLGILSILAVYSAYEFGYLVNDAITVRHETNPTLRLTSKDQEEVENHLAVVFFVRSITTCLCILGIAALARATGRSWVGPVVATTAVVSVIHLTYLAYNRLRGLVTIPLFLILVTARFGGPILIAGSFQGRPWSHQVLAIILVYPLVHMLEFAGKTRFKLLWLQSILPRVDAWRIWYYGCLALVAWYILPKGGQAVLAIKDGSIYFLCYRILTFIISRQLTSNRLNRRINFQ